ncbi:MAG TPA: hypothetical protein DCZ40_08740 [Lachnospiraceae bacterium]|nr:hypothetical protein [Lachnospiraceae bacterium]
MEGYIDIHSHILPGIDDGAKNFEMSMEMLRIAEKSGIRSIILTPHHKPMRRNAGPESIKELMGQLNEAMHREGMDIRLYAGNEFYYSSETVRVLEEKRGCTMAGSGYVLVEFGPMDNLDYIRGGIYQILSAGYCPVLAHVERYESVCAKAEHVKDLAAMGCYIQVNAGSVMGQFGMETKQFARKLLKYRMVHFVATDAHDNRKRMPALSECARYLERKYGKEYMEELLRINPMHMIADRYL